MNTVEDFANDVFKELTEMKKLGINVPKKAFERTKDLVEMAEYDNMKVSDCADLLLNLGWKMKLFTAFWSPKAFVIGRTETVNKYYFSEDNAYTKEDIEAINNLEIDEKWICPDYGEDHTVTRTQ